MSGLLKIKLFVQAVSLFDHKHEIKLNTQELPSDAITTYITLDTIEVEISDPQLTDEQFQAMRTEQLNGIKDKIMSDAKKQCEALV